MTQVLPESIAPEPVEVNPYLEHLYAPVGEETTAADLEVIGEIPIDLNGVYLRNGPNPRFAPQGRYHWFDGDGMIHALQISGGKASYRNRWVRTRAFDQESQAGAGLWKGVMEHPGTLLFDGIVKYDTTTGARSSFRFGPGRWGSEAPFAPRDNSQAEDDGYLVSFVQDEAAGRSEVVILDSADIESGPVARVLLPTRVPIGFHAAWIRGDQMTEGA